MRVRGCGLGLVLARNFTKNDKEQLAMRRYNILILGAAYGSLRLPKMLFGGHKIHHVCLLPRRIDQCGRIPH